MGDVFKHIRDFVTDVFTSPARSAGILLFCLIMLFAPETLKTQTGLDKFVEKFGVYVYMVAAICLAALAVQLTQMAYLPINRRLESGKRQSMWKKYLSTIEYGEKLVLKTYISNQSKTYILDGNTGPVLSLVRNGILYSVGTGVQTNSPYYSVPMLEFNYVIVEEVYNYLLLNPQCLEFTPTELALQSQKQ